MANEIEVTITGEETVSDELEEVADAAHGASNEIEQAMASTEQAFDSAARASGNLGESLDLASGAFSQLSGGIGDVGGAMTAFSDLQNLSKNKALEMEAANLAVERAQQDYNETVAEFGPDSLEAREAQAALNQAMAAAQPPSGMAEWGEKLELISPIIMGVVGVTDLAILANTALSASWVKQTASMVAGKVAMVATTTATGIATAAQWAWNIAMSANPIGLIIAAVMILVGVIILIATKTTWFQDIWKAVWGFLEKPVKALVDFVVNYFTFMWNFWTGILTKIKDFFVGAFKFAIDFVVGYFNFVYSIPGKIADVFRSVASAIFAPFRAAFNAIANAWNNTVGRISFKLPDWIPGIGGNGFSMPRIPTLAVGGDVVRSGLAMIHRGERIVPADAAPLGSTGRDGRGIITVVLRFVGGDATWRKAMQKSVRVQGAYGGTD